MKYLLFVLIILSTPGCFYLGSNSNNDYEEQLNHKYDYKYYPILKENEVLIKSRYHYVVSYDSDCCYIKRTYFPETMQITAEERFIDEELTIKDGPVIYWYDNGVVKSQGEYKKDKASGVWENYLFPSGLLKSEGKYENNKKEDLWTYYDSKGRKYLEVSYIADEFDGGFTKYDSLKNVITKGFYLDDAFIVTEGEPLVDESPFNEKIVEESPYLKSCEHILDIEEREECSKADLLEFVYSNLSYPEKARQNDVEGKVIIHFVVSNTGEIIDIAVPSGICQDMKNECLEILDEMPPWNPGIKDGRPVKVKYTLPVKFKLEG